MRLDGASTVHFASWQGVGSSFHISRTLPQNDALTPFAFTVIADVFRNYTCADDEDASFHAEDRISGALINSHPSDVTNR